MRNPGTVGEEYVAAVRQECLDATLAAARIGIVQTAEEAARFQWQCLATNNVTL